MSSIFDIMSKNILSESSSDSSRSLNKILGNLQTISSISVPIQPDTSEWQVLENPERLSRKFLFDNIRKLKIFLSDLIDYQEENHHHAEITILHDGVVVETYTHDLELVTDLDKELSRFADELYDELNYYFFDNQEKDEHTL